MRAVLLSIKPEWCYEIANGYKTMEIRKDCPNLDTPFKCYIYCTKKYPLIAFADCYDFRSGKYETEVSLIEGYGRKLADMEPTEPKPLPTYSPYCGKPLRIIGSERFCFNVNCPNRYQPIGR